MKMLSAAVTQIQTGYGSMDQTQMYTLIASIKGTAPVTKPPYVYVRNPVQIYSNLIIYYGIAVGAKRYRYTTAALSRNKFDHTMRKFLDITSSLAERSNKSGWGSVTGFITDVKLGPNTYELLCEYVQFMVKEVTAHIKVDVAADNKCAEQNSEMFVTSILASISPQTRA